MSASLLDINDIGSTVETIESDLSRVNHYLLEQAGSPLNLTINHQTTKADQFITADNSTSSFPISFDLLLHPSPLSSTSSSSSESEHITVTLSTKTTTPINHLFQSIHNFLSSLSHILQCSSPSTTNSSSSVHSEIEIIKDKLLTHRSHQQDIISSLTGRLNALTESSKQNKQIHEDKEREPEAVLARLNHESELRRETGNMNQKTQLENLHTQYKQRITDLENALEAVEERALTAQEQLASQTEETAELRELLVGQAQVLAEIISQQENVGNGIDKAEYVDATQEEEQQTVSPATKQTAVMEEGEKKEKTEKRERAGEKDNLRTPPHASPRKQKKSGGTPISAHGETVRAERLSAENVKLRRQLEEMRGRMTQNLHKMRRLFESAERGVEREERGREKKETHPTLHPPSHIHTLFASLRSELQRRTAQQMRMMKETDRTESTAEHTQKDNSGNDRPDRRNTENESALMATAYDEVAAITSACERLKSLLSSSKNSSLSQAYPDGMSSQTLRILQESVDALTHWEIVIGLLSDKAPESSTS